MQFPSRTKRFDRLVSGYRLTQTASWEGGGTLTVGTYLSRQAALSMDYRFPVDDLDLSGQIKSLICMV